MYASALCISLALRFIICDHLESGVCTLTFGIMQVTIHAPSRWRYRHLWYWMASSLVFGYRLLKPEESDLCLLVSICIYSLGLELPGQIIALLSAEIIAVQMYGYLYAGLTDPSAVLLALLLPLYASASDAEPPTAEPLRGKRPDRSCVRTSTSARMSMEATDLKLTRSWFDLGSGIVTIFNQEEEQERQPAELSESGTRSSRSASLDLAIADLRSSTASKAVWVIEAHRLKKLDSIGRGACGTVYRGTFDGQPVAVKEIATGFAINKQQHADYVAEVLQEASVLASLAHPQVLRFYGISIKEREMLIVTELMHCSLNDLIGTPALCQEGANSSSNPPNVTATARISNICFGISSGMAYLHSLGYTHRDLKPANCLCNTELDTVKIADFGIAIQCNSTDSADMMTMTSNLGTPAYMAPELCQDTRRTGDKILSSKLDVYSFGLCCWAMYHNAKPYSECHFTNVFMMMNAIVEGMRPTISADCSLWVASLIQRCWCDDPEQRPSFEEISRIFKDEIGALAEKIDSEAESPAESLASCRPPAGTCPGSVLQTRLSGAVLVV
jgi:hypothetical protein